MQREEHNLCLHSAHSLVGGRETMSTKNNQVLSWLGCDKSHEGKGQAVEEGWMEQEREVVISF